jgi:hypothetical protein
VRKNSATELWAFLDAASGDDEKRIWLERHMSCELAVAAGLKGVRWRRRWWCVES